MSPTQPDQPAAVAFVDGQNLFHAAREAFGYDWPNYDPAALAERICRDKGWRLAQVRFYTGVPEAHDNAFWSHFWKTKLGAMDQDPQTYIYYRRLRYRSQTIRLPDGGEHSILIGHEKGIDVRISLDVLRLAVDRHYDVGLILSQDQDLTEAVEEVKAIARTQERWIRLASAFPLSETSVDTRGINKTDWIPVGRDEYDACLDPTDYRPVNSGNHV